MGKRVKKINNDPAKKVSKNTRNCFEKRVVKRDSSTDSELIVWTFDEIDRDGPFAFDVNRNDFDSKEIVEKVISFSSVTWAELKRQTHDANKSKHHFLNYDGCSNEAKERFIAKDIFAKGLEENVFSFRLQNKLRIIGVRDGRFFRVMWYDPEHCFYPSDK